MVCLWECLYLIIGVLGLTVTSSNVITSKAVECECLQTNTTNTSNLEQCKDNVQRCTNSDSDRPGACFVLWATNNITGMYSIHFSPNYFRKMLSNTHYFEFFVSIQVSRMSKWRDALQTALAIMRNVLIHRRQRKWTSVVVPDTCVTPSTNGYQRQRSHRNVKKTVCIAISVRLFGVYLNIKSFCLHNNSSTSGWHKHLQICGHCMRFPCDDQCCHIFRFVLQK